MDLGDGRASHQSVPVQLMPRWAVGRPAILCLTFAMVLASSCGGSKDGEVVPPSGQVSGLVVQVFGKNILELDRLRIRDETGKEWEFTAVDGFIWFTPSHLREHQLSGLPVVVTYEVRGDELVALKIDD